jgi:hypothetical protein
VSQADDIIAAVRQWQHAANLEHPIEEMPGEERREYADVLLNAWFNLGRTMTGAGRIEDNEGIRLM